jgi:CHAT domain-containing protein
MGGNVGVTLLNIGYAHVSLHSPDSALSNYQQALEVVRASGVTSTEALTLQAMGSAYRERDAPGDRQHAVAYYDSATAVMGRIGSHAGSDESRLSLGERQSPAYVEWALAWLSRDGETGLRPARLAALGAVERGRAQALLALMREERRRSAPVPEPGGDLGREVRQLVRSGVPTGAALLSYLVSSDTLVSWLVLGPDSVLVERTAVRRDSVVDLVGAVRASLGVDERARGMGDLERSSILVAPRSATHFASTAARASALLLPPALLEALPAGRELIVVPHGPLAMLPFAALPLGDEPLGARYALRYAPSLAALAEAEARPSLGRDRKGILADEEKVYIAGDPPMPSVRLADGDSLTLASLPGAAEEAKWLAGTLVPLPWSNPRDGTEQGVKSLGLSDRGVTEEWNRVFGFGGKKLIHLATHGFAYSSESRARDSFIALAPGGDEDGLLTVGEVLDDLPTLEADLVVLSACQTGLGNLSEAEGTVGLQRAFLAKGARSVLVSLWNVSDEATGLLMRQFYTHWLNDSDVPSKAEALRRAQEDVRRTAGFEHPRFWAAFQLVGAS